MMKKKSKVFLFGMLILCATMLGACDRKDTSEQINMSSETVESEPIVSEPIVSEPIVSEPIESEPAASEPVETETFVPEEVETNIKIALIDTGIAKEAINSEHVLPGWNYCTDSDDTEDTIGHGTSLAGMILGSDKANIIGKAPDAYIVPLVCQAKDEEGNIAKVEPEELAQIITDAVFVYQCNIINISAGVKTDYDVLREAVKEVSGMGVLIISGAGNEGNSDIYYPGGYEHVLCVGSVNKEMTGKADFSQDNETVDLLAPGEMLIVPTMKGNPMEVSGTSYSVAYVTAVAAKLWQENPESVSQEVEEEIMKHTIYVEDDRILSLE